MEQAASVEGNGQTTFWVRIFLEKQVTADGRKLHIFVIWITMHEIEADFDM